jgi:hypothetical protein
MEHSSSSHETITALVEVVPGQNGWQGRAYAASMAQALDSQEVRGNGMDYQQALVLSALPQPRVIETESAFIKLDLDAFEDASGLAKAIVLERRPWGSASWSEIASFALPLTSQAVSFLDLSVTAGQSYEYATSVRFALAGAETTLVQTVAKEQSGPVAAARLQPDFNASRVIPVETATPEPDLPEGWAFYPNPVKGDTAWVMFKAKAPGALSLQMHNILAERVLVLDQKIASAGWQKVEVGLKGLASGLYLLKLSFKEDGQLVSDQLSFKKIAIMK